jgi:aspartyl-tRNA(Asn)/glutamyl-tRNA(Gln) amidotransferase subunit A
VTPYATATEIAAAVAAKRASPVEVVEASLARLAAVEPAINAFAVRLEEQALAAAREAEAAIMRGVPAGPLAGVPLTVKDNVAMAGHVLGNGSRTGTAIAAADALIVARLKAAGAIIVGRTTLPEFAHRVLTDNPVHGITRNPWNLAHTPGGSSGGGAAALAAGVAPLAIGTDGGGSIRCPASCVGAVGLKPTLGAVPFESFPDAFGCFAFAGPITRTAADAALMFAAMAGPTPLDPWSRGHAPPSGQVRAEGAAKGVRIGWLAQPGGYPLDGEVRDACEAALAALAGEGAAVAPLRAPCFDAVWEVYQVLATAGHAGRFGALDAAHGEALTPAFRRSVALGRRWSGEQVIRAQDRRGALYRAVQALFETLDVIATPTAMGPPPPVETDGGIDTGWYAAWGAPLYPLNLAGNPAISAPAGFSRAGLPLGLQLVAPFGGEQRLLDLAALLEARLGLGDRRPPL